MTTKRLIGQVLIGVMLFVGSAIAQKFEGIESGTFTGNSFTWTNQTGRTLSLGSVVGMGNLTTNAKSQITITCSNRTFVLASGNVSNNIAWIDGTGGMPCKPSDTILIRVSSVTNIQTNAYIIQPLTW